MGETFDDVKGKAKEAFGDATDNKDLEREGKTDQVASDVKEKVGNVTDKVKDVINRD